MASWSCHGEVLLSTHGEWFFEFPRLAGVGLFAEDADFGGVAFGAVDVDGEVFEVVDELLEIFGPDLRKGERNAVLAERVIQMLVGLDGNEAGQAHAGPEQLHGDADVDCGLALHAGHLLVGLDQDAEIFGAGFDGTSGGSIGAGWRARVLAPTGDRAGFEGSDEPLGFVGGDSAS